MDRQERRGKNEVFGEIKRVYSRRKYVGGSREPEECNRKDRRI